MQQIGVGQLALVCVCVEIPSVPLPCASRDRLQAFQNPITGKALGRRMDLYRLAVNRG